MEKSVFRTVKITTAITKVPTPWISYTIQVRFNLSSITCKRARIIALMIKIKSQKVRTVNGKPIIFNNGFTKIFKSHRIHHPTMYTRKRFSPTTDTTVSHVKGRKKAIHHNIRAFMMIEKMRDMWENIWHNNDFMIQCKWFNSKHDSFSKTSPEQCHTLKECTDFPHFHSLSYCSHLGVRTCRYWYYEAHVYHRYESHRSHQYKPQWCWYLARMTLCHSFRSPSHCYSCLCCDRMSRRRIPLHLFWTWWWERETLSTDYYDQYRSDIHRTLLLLYHPACRMAHIRLIFISMGLSLFERTFAEGITITPPTNLPEFIDEGNVGASIARLIQTGIWWITVLAVIALTYAGIKYVLALWDAGKMKKATMLVIYTLVWVLLSVSAYAIVSLVTNLSF